MPNSTTEAKARRTTSHVLSKIAPTMIKAAKPKARGRADVAYLRRCPQAALDLQGLLPQNSPSVDRAPPPRDPRPPTGRWLTTTKHVHNAPL